MKQKDLIITLSFLIMTASATAAYICFAFETNSILVGVFKILSGIILLTMSIASSFIGFYTIENYKN